MSFHSDGRVVVSLSLTRRAFQPVRVANEFRGRFGSSKRCQYASPNSPPKIQSVDLPDFNLLFDKAPRSPCLGESEIPASGHATFKVFGLDHLNRVARA